MSQTANRSTCPSLYDTAWISRASAMAPSGSWARDVIETLSGSGGAYLGTLRTWYDCYPVASAWLKNALESFANPDHLGAVNELVWWEFMRLVNWSAQVLPRGTQKRPDFQVLRPAEFYIEVTTLNISDADKKAFSAGRTVGLNHSDSMERTLRKITDEKLDQIQFGAAQGRASVMVMFDYTLWSSFATHFYLALADRLLGADMVFRILPSDLSAIAYIERKVFDGRVALTVNRSAVCHNPEASHKIPTDVFRMFRQYSMGPVETPPIHSLADQNGWMWVKARQA